MNTWYVYKQVKFDQVNKYYIAAKHILIRQGQSSKNDYNEHLASKWSFGHVMQLRAMQKSIACPTHNQCKIHEVFASRIQDPTRVQVCGTQDSLATSRSTKKKKCYKAMK